MVRQFEGELLDLQLAPLEFGIICAWTHSGKAGSNDFWVSSVIEFMGLIIPCV